MKGAQFKSFVGGLSPDDGLPLRSWDRQPTERDKAWKAFVAYRDLGVERTLREAAKAVGLTLGHVGRWSAQHQWKRRAEEMDRHLDRVAQHEREAAIKEMARKHVMAAEFMWRKALEVIQKTPTEDIAIRDAIAMFRAAIPAERQGRLAEQAHIPANTSAQLFGNIDDEDGDFLDGRTIAGKRYNELGAG